jgi:hypothetical protein
MNIVSTSTNSHNKPIEKITTTNTTATATTNTTTNTTTTNTCTTNTTTDRDILQPSQTSTISDINNSIESEITSHNSNIRNPSSELTKPEDNKTNNTNGTVRQSKSTLANKPRISGVKSLRGRQSNPTSRSVQTSLSTNSSLTTTTPAATTTTPKTTTTTKSPTQTTINSVDTVNKSNKEKDTLTATKRNDNNNSNASNYNLVPTPTKSYAKHNWLRGGRDAKWNSLGTLYKWCLYIHKQLKWPIEHCYVTSDYEKGGLRFATVTKIVFQSHGFLDYLPKCDVSLQLLVWCVASLNHFGEVRPFIFNAPQDGTGNITPLLCSSEKDGQIRYVMTWPFTVDMQQLIIQHDNTKTKFLSTKDFNITHYNRKKIMEAIPSWIYRMII